ncbi:hypothetical protein [Streptomyces sp. NBC_01304]|uniref:hypothetical protein n=1 Tax=Streptomyces sp. NBC_01304 TaxID=2903818 RepID=UPI002E0E471E|nr:hypothetical protein OG430_14200 [Streptomyces sp. NBC_01304]
MPTPSTEITLSTSRTLGLVAITSGKNYKQAEQALEAAGFSRQPNGAYTASLADDQAARRTASTLVAHAHEHGTTINTSPRPYLGDIGTEIAARLPGTWSAQLEIYSHPIWQEDLWYALWEAGEIYRALEDHRVPFASVLKDGSGTELLLIERPGHPSGYLIGALTDHEKEDVRDDPTTPHSMVLPAEPDQAASAITSTFLPAYQRALHNRDLNTVLSALERIREEHQSFQVIKTSGRYTDGVPLSSRLIDSMERAFADHAWISYRIVLEHAPVLLARCQPTTSPWPEDAAALTRLRAALTDSEAVWQESNTLSSDLHAIPRTLHTHEWSHVRAQLGMDALPAIETWLTDSDVFERQARAVVPGEQATLSAPSPRMLTAHPALPPTPRAPTAHR